MKVRIRLSRVFVDSPIWWSICGRSWSIECYRDDGYATEQGALRAARRLCKRLGLTITKEG